MGILSNREATGLRSRPYSQSSAATAMNQRFTIDGSQALEARLGQLCQRVLGGVQALIPKRKLEGLVLGGGYGRGEGGVLKTEAGEEPYNDLEFYVFLRGHRLVSEWKFRSMLEEFVDFLSPEAGLHVEFKIESLDRLRNSPISMFSYDLVSAHRLLAGPDDLFRGCDHHLAAERIPLAEATRLLFNRCTGLLLAKDFLRAQITPEKQDFIARNIAKAQLSLGDVLLAVAGQYHWSCRERHDRLNQLKADLPWLEQIRAFHAAGIEFKLHPTRSLKPVRELEADHSDVSRLASEIWVWLEARRLNCNFASPDQYAFSSIEKCPETSRWRNFLLNLKSFGWRAALDACCWRYPRER